MNGSHKGLATTVGPPTKLLHMLSIYQQHHCYLNLKDYLEGPCSAMADDASQFIMYTAPQLLTHFNTHYPQPQPWVLWTPALPFHSVMIMTLYRLMSPPELFLHDPPLLITTGPIGAISVPNLEWILPSKSSKMLSLSPSLYVPILSWSHCPPPPPMEKCSISHHGRCCWENSLHTKAVSSCNTGTNKIKLLNSECYLASSNRDFTNSITTK